MIKRTNKALGLILGLLFLFMTSSLEAWAPQSNQYGPRLAKTAATKVTRTLINIGNWSSWVYYEGKMALDPANNSGGIYPRASAAAIFQEGIVWGGYYPRTETQRELRVGGFAYRTGTQPGWVEGTGASAVAIDANNDRARIYRIRRDWATLTNSQVKQDAAEVNMKTFNDVSDAECEAVIAQYADDWANWPVDLGAPWVDIDGDGIFTAGTDEPGIANADQVIWWVMNDLESANTTYLYGSQPIGLELQITVWGYNQPNAALGQIIFQKYKFINKSGKLIDSMFVCKWCDPDVGVSSNDFAGCDTLLSLGYAYNGESTDGDYDAFGIVPPAAGYDFFQGPLVPGIAGQDLNKNGIDDAIDTGIKDLKRTEAGWVNLPMTSFTYFAAGSAYDDPDQGVYDGTLQFYNLLRGFTPSIEVANPSPYIAGAGPYAGQPTVYPLSGDPVAGTGDIDGTGTNLPSGDRRILLSSGPFNMAVGDTQEVVVALVGGLGSNNISSVNAMKTTDIVAQKLYNDLFATVPKAPASPTVIASPYEDKIVITWGDDATAVAVTEAKNPVTGYDFQGYNLYQLPSASSSKDQAVRIGTFDLTDGVTTINGRIFVAEYGQVVDIPVQFGEDKGVQRYFVVDKDYLDGTPLIKGKAYYFAVTAYNYNESPQLIEDKSLESSLLVTSVTVQGSKPGERFGADPADLVTVTHTGASDGQVQITVVDPSKNTGHEYQIYFTVDEDSTSDTYGELLWNVRDVTAGTVKVSGQPQSATFSERSDQPVFDGLQVKVTGPPNDFKDFQCVANASGDLGDNYRGAAANWYDFPSTHTLSPNDYGAQQSTNSSTWLIHTGDNGSRGPYEEFIPRVTQGGARWPLIVPYDWEIRFTSAGGVGYEPNAFVTGAGTGGTVMPVPFELWNTGINTPDDASDDIRYFPYLIDNEADGVFNLWAFDHSVSGGDNDPESDWIYWVIPADETPGSAGYNAIANDVQNNTANHEYLGALTAGTDAIRRMVFVSWNGGSVGDGFPGNQRAAMPETGTVFRIITNKPNAISDQFAFTAPAVTNSDALAKEDIANINVFPNPYYANNPEEPNRFNRFVTFNHLPQKATIRIFNLAGVQVRKLEKDDATQFNRWDLRNSADLPVASGMYVAYIDMPDLGKTKMLKLMIIQSQQILEYY